MTYLRWLFWIVVYAFRPTPKSVEGYIRRGLRTIPPWWKFEPCVWRNEDGKMWEVRLEDESAFTRETMCALTVHVGQKSRRVVGVTLYDEGLRAAARLQRPEDIASDES